MQINNNRGWIEEKERNLKDPLVDDDNSDIESPPLKDCQERSKRAPLANNPFFHHRSTQPNLTQMTLEYRKLRIFTEKEKQKEKKKKN